MATDAERQRAYRQRHRRRLREEQAARRERERQQPILGLNGRGSCECCGETRPVFLAYEDDRLLCWNCRHAIKAFGLCPHQAISRRLG